MFRSIALACAVMLAPAITSAQQPSSSVVARNVWLRATPLGASTGAVYLTLTSPTSDKLTGAASPAAGTEEVHEMSMDGNVMRMRPVPGGLALPAGKPVTLQPGGYHIMLEQLKAPLKQGQSIPVHLTFQKSPALDVTAHVERIGAAGPATSEADAQPMALPGMKMSK